jgi:hypothetical protein
VRQHQDHPGEQSVGARTTATATTTTTNQFTNTHSLEEKKGVSVALFQLPMLPARKGDLKKKWYWNWDGNFMETKYLDVTQIFEDILSARFPKEKVVTFKRKWKLGVWLLGSNSSRSFGFGF